MSSTIDFLFHPRLRPGLATARDADPRYLYLCDQFRITSQPLRLTRTEFSWLQLINGRRSLRDIQADAMKLNGGLMVSMESIERLLLRLDESFFLDNDRFNSYLTGPDREPSCIGCYNADPSILRSQLSALFTGPGGPGLPGEPGCRIVQEGRVRAVLVPHIDYARGGVTYGWGFKEIIERTDASLFVVIATSHYSPERFTVTRKNFKSPLGKVATDQDFIDRLERHYGDGIFNDPIAHFPEHSVELEVVMLQYLYEGKKPFRIVPMVVGSFGDCVGNESDPRHSDDIRAMIDALRIIEAEIQEPICYVISGDLAHIGPKFKDPQPVAEPFLSESLAQDYAILKQAEAANAKGYFDVVAAERDRRNICGLPPTYTTLETAKPTKGKLLHYGRYVHPEGYESVSFASVAFE